ncbi:MAG: hypothetical protein A2504_09825 [Bdellovibrionales bacterium RIFOXYD12_FULL_39_22]|nr:MAG: hypothetical protein A2385_12850 [Bdellovibrionales bacterium RIFOXYB1_FULL_39_21]OFZ43782.1 MAG: hypothetical protein A2485_04665 [Bdellovibrionales bacterium RIFOXYC12_FULL_39_17]OFZ47682.1 MAG: hypothetical protein A2404_09620 [Bdellovibrionales bacterium RIFOXYC1_FULL_39_130]OFZ76464.1 MAG: hypothetical protein A2560_17730 [Bdellovibrionales bacterium RIFOXYD1_FULL_39_84]OFZ95131.1 MAG: hypothetical protein A2504_09825 [Bdellovibrionales bacterium RIFOXYD12_FULL_39_22]
MSSPESGLWSQAGETLSEKTALKEFGLSYEEIVKAIKAGKLQYRMQSVFGNPFIRLLRREVEGLVKAKKGDNFFQEKKLKNELQKNNTNLRSLKRQITVLEKRKDELLKLLKKI